MAAGQQTIGLTLSDLLSQVLPELTLSAANAAVLVQGITLDSRNVSRGDVFIAYPGASHDGREFIAQALSAGAAAVLVESEGFVVDRFITDPFVTGSFITGSGKDERIIPVAGLASQASAIAGCFYRHPSRDLVVTGITGTNGKTTCTHLLAQLYTLLGNNAGVLGTLGAELITAPAEAASSKLLISKSRPSEVQTSEIQSSKTPSANMTTADAVTTQALLAELRDAGADYVTMEVSSHGLVQSRVADVRFDTAVFTNLSRDHLDYHGDMAAYLAAKAQLFNVPGLQRAVINIDDPAGRELAAQLPATVECLRFGIVSAGAGEFSCEVRAENCRYTRQGISADIITPWGSGELRSTLLGAFNLSNVLAVIAAVCAQGKDFDAVLSAIPRLQSVAGRMQLVAEDSNLASGEDHAPQVVVDYAHTPDALSQALSTLREQCTGKLWCVFGCGGDRDRGKRALMAEVAGRSADRVVVTSDNPRNEDSNLVIEDILQGIPAEISAPNLLVEADRRAAIRIAISQADSADTVLIAGKGHERYQEVAGVRWPFDDVAEAVLALGERRIERAESKS
ncbi:MAG: UDP-N-acetylmuramoyl-L-alanyl-D-glutamate--2,6-diaminopimelate ligase [Porticoccaceae bacterium]|nr:UDP-N-acetylmuramoyl-L-alanyl-D-glutamate--2,6-diaminopimelate ligase [Porticoccaceae bacterium]